MNPGPQLHRSLTFWAGLLVILFTCWSWRDSCTHDLRLQCVQFNVDSKPHGLLISRSTGWTLRSFDALRRPASRYPDPSLPREVFPSPFLVRAEKTYLVTKTPLTRTWKEEQQSGVNVDGPGSWSFHLPYWLILLSEILIWTLLLLFRAHRRRRAIALPLNEASS